MKKENKKYGIGTWVAAVALLLFAIVLLILEYRQMTSEAVLRTEAVNITKRTFGVDIERMEFTYENTLSRFQPGGRVSIKAKLTAWELEDLNERYQKQFEDNKLKKKFAVTVAERLGLSEEEVKENNAFVFLYGMKRYFRFNLYDYRDGGLQIMYIQELNDGTGILHIDYEESGEEVSMIWLCLVPTLVLILLLAYLLYRVQGEQKFARQN